VQKIVLISATVEKLHIAFDDPCMCTVSAVIKFDHKYSYGVDWVLHPTFFRVSS